MDINIDVGPSAPPIIATAEACSSVKLNTPVYSDNIIAPTNAPNIPNCAAPPNIAVLGFASSGPKSVIAPTPINISSGKSHVDIQVTPVAASTPAPVVSTPAPSNVSGSDINASVNGNVWKILVKEGDKVSADQTIIILEAMKMEIDIKSPIDGVIKAIKTTPNEAVTEGQVLAIVG